MFQRWDGRRQVINLGVSENWEFLRISLGKYGKMKIKQKASIWTYPIRSICLVCESACCRWKRLDCNVFQGYRFVGLCKWFILGYFSMNWDDLSDTFAGQEFSTPVASWVLGTMPCYMIVFVSWSSTQPLSTIVWRPNAKIASTVVTVA